MSVNELSTDTALASDVAIEFMTSLVEELAEPDESGGSTSLDADSFAKEVEVLNTVFGESAVSDAMGQLFKEKLADAAMGFVGRLGLSPVESDAIGEAIEGDMSSSGVNSGSDVGQATSDVVGDDLDKLIDMIMERWIEEIQDDTKKALQAPRGQNTAGGGAGADGGAGGGGGVEGGGAGDGAVGGEGVEGSGSPGDAGGANATEGGGAVEEGGAAEADQAGGASEEAGGAGGTEGGGDGAASGNWLVVLASAMGEASGKHLKKMVELGNEMGSVDSEANPEALPKLNAEFSAESQIFKMFQEAISTVIKSIGEGMSSVARKS